MATLPYDTDAGEFVDFETLDDWLERDEAAAEIARLRAELDAMTEEMDAARTKALEDAAKVAESRWQAWPHYETHGKPEVTRDVTACQNIAAAIRAMIKQEDKG